MPKRRGHNEGTIRQRADGRWEAMLSLPNGKRWSLYAKSRAEVQVKLRAAQRDTESGLDLSVGQRLTVEKYLEKWLTSSVMHSVKTKTWEGYESIVRVRVNPRIGSRALAKLTTLDLQALYSDLLESGLTGRSVQHTHRVVRAALTQAIRWNLIARNPSDGATAPRAKKSEMRVLSHLQVNTLLDTTREHPMHALYVLAVTTGMRQGELLGLRWEDIDLVEGKLAVRRALQRQRAAGLVFVTPKTSGSSRSIVMSKHTVLALSLHKDRQSFFRRDAGEQWQDQGLVFANRTGGPLDPSHQTATFKRALAKATLPAIRFHDLRHTAATLLLSKGVHPKVVSEMLGHGSITLTLDTYSHLLPTMHDHAAATMDALLSA